MNRTEYMAFLAVVTIDDELKELDIRKLNCTEEINNLEKQECELSDEINQKSEIVHNLKKNVHFKELEIKTLDNLATTKQQKLNITSQAKEYLALVQELNTLNQEKEKIDEVLLNFWQDLEAAEKLYNDIKIINNQKIEDAQKNIKIKQKQIIEIDKEQKQLVEDRQTHIKYISKELYQKYVFKTAAAGQGAVRVQNDSCSVCFYPIFVQDLSAIRDYQIRECKDCYRILYQKP